MRGFWGNEIRPRFLEEAAAELYEGSTWIEVFYLLKLILRARNQNGGGVQHAFDLHALKHDGFAFGFPISCRSSISRHIMQDC